MTEHRYARGTVAPNTRTAAIALRRCIRTGTAVWFLVIGPSLAPTSSAAIPLDKEGDLKLGVRTYVNARIGTEDTDEGNLDFSRSGKLSTVSAATFPYSAAGHLRQNRFFLEAELKHDLSRLVKKGAGPLAVLKNLPFEIKGLNYDLTFRAEADSIYDWGPREYSTATAFKEGVEQAKKLGLVKGQAITDVGTARDKLRRLGVDRERLFQAYVEGSIGNMFMRLGRQNLSWGETDVFRLLDNINPLDSSFGGFLVSLDERRIPLDMAKLQYYVGDSGPISELFVEGYAAIDDSVGFYPGVPTGSPWALPGQSVSNVLIDQRPMRPARTLENARGGARLVFNAFDATFSLAHYYTYFDLPDVQLFTHTLQVTVPFNDGVPCPNDPNDRSCGSFVHVMLRPQRVQVTGASISFAIPQQYAVVRSEFAYFKDEPAYSQGQCDPFIFTDASRTDHPRTTGGTRLRDSLNASIGFDMQRYIRFLNPTHTFFASAQFFYKHILNAGDTAVWALDRKGQPFPNPNREILPIIVHSLPATVVGLPLEPLFITQPADSYLNTLFIGTSYRSSTINPGVSLFYDWGGSFVFQPGVTFARDPFRFSIDYNRLEAGTLKGGSGISLLRDRDSVQFKLEYVI